MRDEIRFPERLEMKTRTDRDQVANWGSLIRECSAGRDTSRGAIPSCVTAFRADTGITPSVAAHAATGEPDIISGSKRLYELYGGLKGPLDLGPFCCIRRNGFNICLAICFHGLAVQRARDEPALRTLPSSVRLLSAVPLLPKLQRLWRAYCPAHARARLRGVPLA